MQYLIATNGRETLVTEGKNYGRSAANEQDAYDQSLGIKMAILNLYLRINYNEQLVMRCYPDYFMVLVPDALLLEVVARALHDLCWDPRREVVERWAPKIVFSIQAFGHTIEDLFEKA